MPEGTNTRCAARRHPASGFTETSSFLPGRLQIAEQMVAALRLHLIKQRKGTWVALHHLAGTLELSIALSGSVKNRQASALSPMISGRAFSTSETNLPLQGGWRSAPNNPLAIATPSRASLPFLGK